MQLLVHIALPEHLRPGGFDHAAIHRASGGLYVAHPVNDALDVIDCVKDRFLHSIPNLRGVAGALVSDEQNLVFTSNRKENTVGIFAPDNEAGSWQKLVLASVQNGLAYDPRRGLLLAANVGDPEIPDSFTLSIVSVKERRIVAVGDPGVVDVFDTDAMERIETVQTERGAHTLAFDVERNKVYAFLPETHRAVVYVDQG